MTIVLRGDENQPATGDTNLFTTSCTVNYSSGEKIQ